MRVMEEDQARVLFFWEDNWLYFCWLDVSFFFTPYDENLTLWKKNWKSQNDQHQHNKTHKCQKAGNPQFSVL